jgi:hypothetical protein
MLQNQVSILCIGYLRKSYYDLSMRIAKNGFRHEFSARFPLSDWQRNKGIRRKIDLFSADEIISLAIKRANPCLIGRIGGTEARFMSSFIKEFPEHFGEKYLFRSWKSKTNLEKRKREAQLNSGFFYDNNLEAERFVWKYMDALKDTDVLGGWGFAFTWPESFALKNSKLMVINKEFTAPWVEKHSYRFETLASPWAQSLDKKKVLIISPFSNTILKQHKIIKKVFPNVYYPDFTIQTINAPLTSGTYDFSNNNWFELLRNMELEIDARDFDIALISCGSYSYPLAQYAKKVGKIGIHCGGALQLFFGIMGNRWNGSTEITKYANNYWTRPTKSETPHGANLIENACYW